MVMGGDSRSSGRGFRIPAPDTGCTFFHIYYSKSCNVCLKRPKINDKKRPGLAQLKNVLAQQRHLTNESLSSTSLLLPLSKGKLETGAKNADSSSRSEMRAKVVLKR